VAELPELRFERSPAPPPPPAPLFGRPANFGVARDLELMKQGALPPRTPRPPRETRLPLRRITPRSRRSRRETGAADLWHRVLCRYGRHDIRGGHQLQLGSEFVYVERRCRWCDKPA
jgi:hypothetical protein